MCSETNGPWRFGPFLKARPVFRPLSVALRWGVGKELKRDMES